MNTKVYIFSLEYGDRLNEKNFIKEILRNFDPDTLVGCGIFVNNNPYNLELLFFASLAKDIDRFEDFLKNRYANKRRVFNYFLDDIVASFSSRGYNINTFIDDFCVDLAITEDANEISLFPCKEKLNSIFGSNLNVKREPRVFLSHSSKDKEMIDIIFNEFQKSEISVWYDKYQIEPGDSITDKINEGLDNSDIGIICISNNFLNSSSGWTKNELHYFVQRRMHDSKKVFIILNFDVPHDALPPLVQDYKYIDFKENDAINTLVDILKKRLNN
jgi:hypothetical protein